MRGLSTMALVDAWEQGLGQPLVRRALTVLANACPDTSPDLLTQLPIGQRDLRLLTVRELTFGPQLTGVVRCPSCRAQLELTFTAAATRAGAELQAGGELAAPPTYSVASGDYELHYRLPMSTDLAAIAHERNLDRARELLLARCILAVSHEGAPASLRAAPRELLDAAVEDMARRDPQGDVQIAFTCSTCGEANQVAFDIAAFFWAEIDAWVTRTLRDVHRLAAAYGWREADILAMSARRRQFYLELAG
jgi:hypothetical protein